MATKTKQKNDNGALPAEEVTLLKAILEAQDGKIETLQGIINVEKQKMKQYIAQAERTASAMGAQIAMMEELLREVENG